MDIVNGRTDHEKSCTPLQAMHVYQHVCSENLEHSATTALQALFLEGISEGKCSPHDTAIHEEQSAQTRNLGKNEVLR
jgi:hypothetical protein